MSLPNTLWQLIIPLFWSYCQNSWKNKISRPVSNDSMISVMIFLLGRPICTQIQNHNILSNDRDHCIEFNKQKQQMKWFVLFFLVSVSESKLIWMLLNVSHNARVWWVVARVLPCRCIFLCVARLFCVVAKWLLTSPSQKSPPPSLQSLDMSRILSFNWIFHDLQAKIVSIFLTHSSELVSS